MSYILKNALSIVAILCFAIIVFFPEPPEYISQNQVMTITAVIIFFLALPVMKIARALIVSKKAKREQ